MRFPSIKNVRAALVDVNNFVDYSEDGCDVRLQVYPDGQWALRWGLSDYDQDHRGFWGSSIVPGGKRRFNATDMARDLIDQCREDKACSGTFAD